MKTTFNLHQIQSVNTSAVSFLLGTLLAIGTVTSVHAQVMASGTISGSGSGPYTYNLTFSDASSASSSIGSVWYSWVPGFFYLPGDPTSASAPAGWTANISDNSVQFVANSSASHILAGQTLSGFSYQAAFSPAQLAAAPNSGDSVAYSGGLFSDGGDTFTVQTVAVPEPSASTLFVSSLIGFVWVSRRGVRALRCSTNQCLLPVVRQ